MNRRDFVQRVAAGAALPALAEQPSSLYDEKYRPQFHFSPRTGWTNDPNGLVFYKGVYHLFFQHNPFDTKWGNMTWGHATSPDLVHWTQVDNALLPDKTGTMFSGSAVVDWENTAGLQQGGEKTIVLVYTAAGGTSPESQGQPFTQCIAYSNDAGKTFTKYAGNPVLPNIVGGNRDPKVIWHAPTKRWIMALYLDGDVFALFTSPDLKKWTMFQQLSVPGCSECPDFFELPVENAPGESKWVLTAANDSYVIGSFDGKKFIPEVLTQKGHFGANFYAVQTYSDMPGTRRVQLAWMNGGAYPGMPFNQQMSCPYELTLRRFNYNSFRMYSVPARELETLRGAPRTWRDVAIKPGENPLGDVTGDTLDINAEFDVGKAKEVGFRVRGRTVSYQVKEKGRDNALRSDKHTGLLRMVKNRVKMRILLDRSSIEVIGNDGETIIPSHFLPPDADRTVTAFCEGGPAKIVSLNIYPMRSAWKK